MFIVRYNHYSQCWVAVYQINVLFWLSKSCTLLLVKHNYSWKKWNTVCLSILSVEDVEDVYIIGIMVTGFLLFGAGGVLFYRKVKKAIAAYSALQKLPANFEALGRAVNTQTQAMCEQNRGLNRKLDLIMEKLDNV